MIDAQHLCKAYPDGEHAHQVLNNLSVSVEQGSSLAITGESGSGKSTLLSLIAGLEKPDSGTLQVAEQNLVQFTERQADDFRRRTVGVIYQDYQLIDCLTALDNLTLPLRLNKLNATSHIQFLVKSLRITDILHKYPAQLSGGEQQRVAIARALSHRPALLLADEPTGALDDSTSETVLDCLFSLQQQLAITMVCVTHSSALAKRAATRMHLSLGKLVQP